MNLLKKNFELFQFLGKPLKTIKNQVSNAQKQPLWFFSSLIILLLSCNACSEDENNLKPDIPGEIIEEAGISVDAFEKYEGEIGMLINARSIARKGYKPTQAMVTINSANGNFSQTIDLDEFSYMGQIKVPLGGLDAATRNELINGVPVSATFRDKNGSNILTDISLNTVSFLSNPTPVSVNASSLEETDEVATIDLNENTSYYLQRVEEDGSPINMSMRWNQAVNHGQVMTMSTNNTFAGDQPDHVFNFIPVPNEPNTFFIKIEANGYLLSNQIVIDISGGIAIHLAPKNSHISGDPFNYPSITNVFKFKVEKVNDGVYIIKNNDNLPIKVAAGIGLTYTHPKGESIYFRIVSKDIDWAVQPIATSIITPVLPEASTAFSFNSTLKNCGSGSLEQTVGVDFSEERSNTIGWEESISINNTSSQSISATVGVEFDATFFGTGATYSASLTAGFDWSQSVTKETSNHGSETVVNSENYFSTRTITVPSGKASLVYDAYQFYENVRIDYVQRLRMSGTNKDGNQLTGKEIESLFQFTRFNGVINKVEDFSVVFTLRGFTVLDKFIETQSSVEDVPANCN